MIDSNNQFKKLSHSLINSVRGVMEATKEGGVPKTDKHKDLAAKAPPHDKITHADVLVGRGVLKKHPTSGKLVTKEEVEEIDEIAKIGKVYKIPVSSPKPFGDDGKVYKEKPVDPKKMTAIGRKIGDTKRLAKEEVEEIDELRGSTLKSYISKSENNIRYNFNRTKKGTYDPDSISPEKDAFHSNEVRKRKIGRDMAFNKLAGRLASFKKEEVEEIDELSKKTLGSYVKKASISAADKGVEHGTKKAERDEMDRVMNRHMGFTDKDKVHGIMKTTYRDYEKPREKAARRLHGIGKAVDKLTREESGLDLARTVLNNIRNEIAEGAEGIDEALDAAARYGQHHAAIKDLLKSIDQHVRSHKDEALKHKDYRGKKGVDWGHVGDISHVHSALAEIHDRLAQQGEYKKSMSESIDESAKSDTHWFSVRGMKDNHLNKLDDMTMGQAGPGQHLEYGENHGHPTFVVGINSKHKNHATTHAFLKKHATPWTKPPRDVNEDVDQIDELSKKTLGSYIKKAGGLSLNSAGSHMYQAGKAEYDTPGSKKLFKQGVKRAQGVETAVNKIVKESPVDGVAPGSMDNDGHLCATKVFHKEWAEGVPIFSQHAEPDANGNIAWYDVMFEHGIEKGVWTEDLEILMTESHERHGKRKMKEENELDEARGRPRKNPLPDGKKGDPDEVEARMHIIQQLERAKLSMRGGEPVSFMDGTKHTVHSPDANKIIMKYHSMKPYEKEIFQKKIHASHAGLKAEL